jgi:hypothetical protein
LFRYEISKFSTKLIIKAGRQEPTGQIVLPDLSFDLNPGQPRSPCMRVVTPSSVRLPALASSSTCHGIIITKRSPGLSFPPYQDAPRDNPIKNKKKIGIYGVY